MPSCEKIIVDHLVPPEFTRWFVRSEERLDDATGCAILSLVLCNLCRGNAQRRGVWDVSDNRPCTVGDVRDGVIQNITKGLVLGRSRITVCGG